jgi:hypothetical protein
MKELLVRRRRVLIVTLGLGILTLARAASATVLVPADLGELVAGARTIVHGKVVDATSQWLEGRRGIETIVTIEVEDALKGAGGNSVSFRVPGGQMGPYRSFMPGAPGFAAGEEVIVFLAGEGPVIPHIVGFSQGVYRVTSLAGGVRLVRPGVPGAAGDASVTLTRGSGSRVAPLEAFKSQVRALVRAEAPAPRAARPRKAGLQ